MTEPSSTVTLYTKDGNVARAAAALGGIARVAFYLAILTAPMRFRFVVESRPQPPVYQDFTDILLFLPDIFVLATLAAWLLSLWLGRKRLMLTPAAFTISLGALILVLFVSTLASQDRILSGVYFLRSLACFGLYLYLVNEFDGLKSLVIPVGGLIFLQSLVGIGQAWQQSSLGLGFLGELDLDPAVSGVSIIGTNEVRTLRTYGLADHPNILGGSLALGLLLFAGGLLADDGEEKKGRRFEDALLPASMLFGLGCLTLYFTYSRAAWMALGSALLFCVVLLWLKRITPSLGRLLGMLAAAGILLAPIVAQNLAFLGVRLNVENSFGEVFYERQSLSERRALNEAGNQIFAENAILGVGPAAFPSALSHHSPDFPFDFQPPHVILLEAAAETGIFGGLMLAVALVLPWTALWINRRRLKFDGNLIFASAALLGVSIIGLFDYYPWLLPAGRYWLWMIWGLWGAVYTRSFREPARD